MTDNIVDFDGITRLDLPASKVLERALSSDLESVVIIGHTKDGDEYFAASSADGGDVVWMIERAKLKLLRTVDDD